MTAFRSIHIIYNPVSTGKSKSNALALHKKLIKMLPSIPIHITATKHAGHAEEIAYSIARKYVKPLIISSSGDGGYNEVINGVMRAGSKAKNPVCAVLASGNANDHSRTMQTRPLWQAIVEGEVTNIDLLKFTVVAEGSKTVRYAHSYAGLGLTPAVAKEVNAHSFNRWQEFVMVFKVFFAYKPFKIKHAGKTLLLDNIVFSNINQMAKVFILTKQNNPDDGQFRVIIFAHTKKRLLAFKIVKAIFGRLEEAITTKSYEFTVVKQMSMQLDGELIDLKAGSTVCVQAQKHGLATVI